MKSARFVRICLMLSSTFALAQRNPVPFVNQPLAPMTAAPGGSGFTLTVNGTGFVSASVVHWNGDSLATTFVNGSQLTATVPASNVTNPGTASVTVVSPAPGGGTSNLMYFDVSGPASTLTFATLDSVMYPSPFVTADFSSNGKVDIAAAGPFPNPIGACVQLGVGDGTFQAPICSPAQGFGPNSIIAADLNGDGNFDIVATQMSQNSVSVLLGNGDGTFQSQIVFASGPVGSQSFAVVSADFNGDGKLDLAVANAPNEAGSSGSVSILLGNGDGTFQNHVDYALGTNGLSSLAVGDFNGDGKLDLVSNSVILLGNGDGTFQSPQPLPSTAGQEVATADLNGDGKLDLVEVSPQPQLSEPAGVAILLGNGDGTFQPPVNYPLNSPFAVAIADFNADGMLDLAVVNNSNPGSASILLGNGDGTFQNPVNFAAGQDLFGLAAADFNGDGKMDLALDSQDQLDGFNLNLIVLLQGTWPALNPYPPLLTFGQQAIGTSSPPQTMTLTNTGTATLTLTSIGISGAEADDFPQTNTCTSPLTANASCQVNVTFTPQAGGNRSAAVSVTDNAPGSPQMLSLTGVTPPAPAASLSPLSVSFPNQYVGTSGNPQTVTLTNTGTAPLTITNVTASPIDFSTLNACGSSVAAGSSCSIGVFFDPTMTGIRAGTMTVTDNAGGSPQRVSLSGTGQDFSVAPSGSSTASITPGQTASYTVAVAPSGGFNQTVVLSCSGAPAQSTCSLSSASVAIEGSTPESVTVTVKTAGTSASFAHPYGLVPVSSRLGLWLGLPSLSGLVLLSSSGGRSRRRPGRRLYGLAFLFLLSLGITWSACGGGSGSRAGGTPAGTYNLMVTGTFSSGAISLNHTAKLTLVVQ